MFLVVDYIACHFIGLIIFDWMPDIVSFTLFRAGNFCNPVNPLELCSGTVTLLQTVESFWILLIRIFLGNSGAVLILELITGHYRGKTFLSILNTPFSSPQCHGWWQQALFPLVLPDGSSPGLR